MSDTAIKSLIDTVKILNDKYDQLEKLTGEQFNIFTILDMESDEVKTHSNFIYELLNPNGSHGSGDLFIRLFLDELPTIEEYGKVINISREYLTENNRYIDFVIETENYFLGIEMKVYANDQKKQIRDYCKTVRRVAKKEGKQARLYYLTLFGDEATKLSVGKLKADLHYQLLSFSNQIYNWIEKCIEKSATKPIVREALVQYQNLIKKLTNKISHNMEKEMEEIIRTPEDIKAAHTIYDEYLTIWANKEAEFWIALYERLKENKIFEEFEIYGHSSEQGYIENDEKMFTKQIKKIRQYNKFFGLILSKEIGNYTMDFIIHEYTGEGKIIYEFSISSNNNDYEKLPGKIINILKEQLGFDCEDNNTDRCWTDLLDLHFAGVKSPKQPTFDLFDQHKFKEYVNETAKKTTEHIEKFLQKEDEILEALSNKRG